MAIMRTLFFQVILWIGVCLGVGLLGSLWTQAGVRTWYPTLVKPSFNPPAWLFGPVWTALYVLMGVAVALVWHKSMRINVAVALFIVQLVLNALWSLLFFKLRSPFWGLVDIFALWILLFLTLVQFFRIQATAGWLLLPYLLWVSFATVLNAAIFWLNR